MGRGSDEVGGMGQKGTETGRLPHASFIDQESSPERAALPRKPVTFHRYHRSCFPPESALECPAHTTAQTWVHMAAEQISKVSRGHGRVQRSPKAAQGKVRSGLETGRWVQDRGQERGRQKASWTRGALRKPRVACGTGDRGKSFWPRLSRTNGSF